MTCLGCFSVMDPPDYDTPCSGFNTTSAQMEVSQESLGVLERIHPTKQEAVAAACVFLC